MQSTSEHESSGHTDIKYGTNWREVSLAAPVGRGVASCSKAATLYSGNVGVSGNTMFLSSGDVISAVALGTDLLISSSERK